MPRDNGNQALLLQQMLRMANVFNRLEMDRMSVTDSVRNEMEENMEARDAMLADAAKAGSEAKSKSRSAARRHQKQPQRHAQSHQLDDGQLVQPGTPEWYSDIASEYAKPPSQVAREEWMKSLIRENKEWVGLGGMSGNYKILDYCAGTGFLSLAFAPYVGKILAIDYARGMAEEFNKIAMKSATRKAYPKCEMKAVWGDLIHPELKPDSKAARNRLTWDVDGEFEGFDMVVMCLAVDFFASKGAPSSVQDAQMKGGLQTLVDRLKHNGTLVIVDIEKTHPESQAYEAQLDDAHYNQAKVDGKKLHGFGSKEICRFGANRCS